MEPFTSPGPTTCQNATRFPAPRPKASYIKPPQRPSGRARVHSTVTSSQGRRVRSPPPPLKFKTCLPFISDRSSVPGLPGPGRRRHALSPSGPLYKIVYHRCILIHILKSNARSVTAIGSGLCPLISLLPNSISAIPTMGWLGHPGIEVYRSLGVQLSFDTQT